MKTFVVGNKGQVTLSDGVMRHLGVIPGDRIVVAELPGGRVVLQAAATAGDISDIFGCLKMPGGPSLSIEDIAALAADGWAGKR